jgi:predicted MFS family arabinose efflux permease
VLTSKAETQSVGSPWAPLRLRVFRTLWFVQLGSNLGSWMQTVGAQWLLVGRPHAATLVALVQTATTLPLMLFGLPAGVFADVFDRRRLLLGLQASSVAVTGVMAGVTFLGQMSSALLLALTFLLGCAAAMALPAWQAIVPELVPREQLENASALGAMNYNVARAVGPALAGVLVARTGAGTVFALNAASFLGGIVLLFAWRRPVPENEFGRERVLPALRAGDRYVWHAPVVRRILLRAALFSMPAIALWALLPLVASRRLGLGAAGYGLLLAAVGLGAVAGALLLPQLRSRLSPSWFFAGATLLYAGALAVTGLVTQVVIVALILVPAGLAWVAILSSLNAAMQLILPDWVRARGLAVYQFVFAGGQAVAAVVWGVLAQRAGLPTGLVVAALLLAAGAATVIFWPLGDAGGLDRSPAIYWPIPNLLLDPEGNQGPVLVTLAWRVEPGQVAGFLEAMHRVRLSRLRTGASSWQLYRDGEQPDRFLELFVVPSWEEHLRQHGGRLTGADHEFEQEAVAQAAGPPEVTHLFPARRQGRRA